MIHLNIGGQSQIRILISADDAEAAGNVETRRDLKACKEGAQGDREVIAVPLSVK
ncbi:hypothetical protein WBG83_12520 [Paenibacillus sp. y28]